ncbi:MAG TPA: PorP/SprF family type IX secretion system membrane protein [Bacteroidia bacterium]|nr:PorP/SprF family type IX secretion system membrane protein [Bacteroidia bacterium]HRS59174.1 PorP/SprF family type IX secretion system membrane protein [Bacteroidia bacterium]HRU67222.1 PorP/SprF family type IX secretion system membrane protein [Bacteroidia bacterium]
MKLIFSLGLILFFNFKLWSQDPISSQYHYIPILLNPSLAGANHYGTRITVNHRNQWTLIPGFFKSSRFIIDTKFGSYNSNIALSCSQDIEGDDFISLSNISLIYAYNLEICRKFIFNFGIMAGFSSQSINWSKFVFSDQLDPVYGKIYNSNAVIPENFSKSYFDWSSGFSIKHKPVNKTVNRNLNYRSFISGVTLNHITSPDDRFYQTPNTSNFRVPINISVFLGGFWESQNDIFDQSSLFYPHLKLEFQCPFSVIDLGLDFTLGNFISGIGSRFIVRDIAKNTNHLVLIFGYKSNFFDYNNLQVTYSFDLSLSGLAMSSFGSHELTLSFLFNNFNLIPGSNKSFYNSNKCTDFYRNKSIPVF